MVMPLRKLRNAPQIIRQFTLQAESAFHGLPQIDLVQTDSLPDGFSEKRDVERVLGVQRLGRLFAEFAAGG